MDRLCCFFFCTEMTHLTRYQQGRHRDRASALGLGRVELSAHSGLAPIVTRGSGWPLNGLFLSAGHIAQVYGTHDPSFVSPPF